MLDDEENSSITGDVAEIKGVATLESEGFSEVRKLSLMLKFISFASLLVIYSFYFLS